MVGVSGAVKLNECLGREESVVVGDREGTGLLVEKINICGVCTASGNAEGRVLNSLKFLNIAVGCRWGPDWCSVIDEWSDDGVVGE